MRYIIILVSFTLCSKCLVVSDNVETKFRFIPKNPSVSIQNGIDVSEDKTHDDSQHFDKIVNRQRRSIWTTFINHLTALSETFHMKPLLAEGLNDMDSFGKTFQKEINKNKDFTNVMLSKDAGNEEKLGKKENENENKKAKKSEEELKKLKATIAKEKLRWVKDVIQNDREITHEMLRESELDEEKWWNKVGKEIYKKRKAKEALKKKEDDENLRGLKEIINSLIGWHNEVVEMEEKMLEELQTEFNMKSEDLKNIYSKGSNLIETEDVFKNHIAGNPELEDYVKSVVGAIRRWRGVMKKIEAKLPKSPLSRFTKKKADEIGPKLAYIKESNQKWFLGKGRSNAIEELSGDEDRFGLKKSNLKTKPKVDEKLTQIRQDWKYLKILHKLVEVLEFELLGHIINHRNDIEADDLMECYYKGTNFLESHKIYKEIVANKPDLENYVKSEMFIIRAMHEELRKIEKNIPKKPIKITGLTEKEIREIEQKLVYYIDSNESWFLGKDQPCLVKEYNYRD